MKNAMMMKLATKATAVAVAATMFAAGVPALAAHAAEKETMSSVAEKIEANVKNNAKVNSKTNLGQMYTDSYPLVTVSNYTGKTIISAYISPSAECGWGDDILLDKCLNPGETMWTQFHAYGNHSYYDVYLIFDDGTTYCSYGYDLTFGDVADITMDIGNGYVYLY